MAHSLLDLCGLSSSYANLGIMTTQAEIHKCKSEYDEAWKIHTKIVQITADQDPHWHATALLNAAEIGVSIGVPKHELQQNIDSVRPIFTTAGHKSGIISCDLVIGALYLRENDQQLAKRLFENSLNSAPEDNEIKSFCFERLGNVSS
jgi:hypothetical protein